MSSEFNPDDIDIEEQLAKSIEQIVNDEEERRSCLVWKERTASTVDFTLAFFQYVVLLFVRIISNDSGPASNTAGAIDIFIVDAILLPEMVIESPRK